MLGLRDAHGLAWKLALVARGLAGEQILSSHTTERLPHNRAIVELSLAMGRVSCELDPASAAERDARLRRADVEPPPFPHLEDGILTGAPPWARSPYRVSSRRPDAQGGSTT